MRHEVPKPDTEAELAKIHEITGSMIAAFPDMDPGIRREVAVDVLQRVTDRAQQAARAAGMYAIAQGDLTRKDAAEKLGVHPATVARWFNEAQAAGLIDEQDQPLPQDDAEPPQQ